MLIDDFFLMLAGTFKKILFYALVFYTSQLFAEDFDIEIPDEKAENNMIAETLLASCSEELMTWRLWFQLEIVTEGEMKQQSIFVDFESKRL